MSSLVTATVSVPLSTASRRLSNPNIAVAKLAEQKGVGPSTGPATLSAFVFPPNSGGLIDANETDEHKVRGPSCKLMDRILLVCQTIPMC